MEPEDEKTANALRLNVSPDATRPRRLGDRVIGSMTAHARHIADLTNIKEKGLLCSPKRTSDIAQLKDRNVPDFVAKVVDGFRER
jgi:hypothetical protein